MVRGPGAPGRCLLRFAAAGAIRGRPPEPTRADQIGPEVRTVIRELAPQSPMYRVFTMKSLAARAPPTKSRTDKSERLGPPA